MPVSDREANRYECEESDIHRNPVEVDAFQRFIRSVERSHKSYRTISTSERTDKDSPRSGAEAKSRGRFFRPLYRPGQRADVSEPRILILGPPGAGKGTQSANIAAEFGVEHVSTGDAFRQNKDMDITDLEVEYDTPGEYMDRGELVPDEVVDAMVEGVLPDDGGFVLDGYPRNEHQVEALEGMSDVDLVLYLEVARKELVGRLTGRRVCEGCGANYHVEYDPPEEEGVCDDCGGDLYRREDDQPEKIRTRIEEYEQQTEPVIERYRETGELVRIDGEGSPSEVWNRLRAAIEAELGS